MTRKLFLEVDFSQEELRVLASLSQDPEMLRCFNNRIDIHSRTASMITGKALSDITKHDRQVAKPTNFGPIYGQSDKGLVSYAKDNFGVIMTQDEAKKYLRQYFMLYSGVRTYQKATIRQARREGCVWVKWQGANYHRRPVFNITSKHDILRGMDERKCLNTPIQGGASLYMLFLLLILRQAKREHLIPGLCEIVGTVHDSVWLEVLEDCLAECFDYVGRIAVGLPLHNVPSEVEGKAGPSLGEAKVIGVVNSLDVTNGKRFDYESWRVEKSIRFV